MADKVSVIDFSEPVRVELNRGIILVLGEILETLGDELLERKEIDQPQAMAIWHLANAIEAVCADSFRPDYRARLDGAKKSMGEFE